MNEYQRMRLKIAARLMAARIVRAGTPTEITDPGWLERVTTALRGADALLAAAGHKPDGAAAGERAASGCEQCLLELSAPGDDVTASLAAELAAAKAEIAAVKALSKCPADQFPPVPLNVWVESRFVHVQDHNRTLDQLHARIAELEARPPHPPGTVTFTQGQVDAMRGNVRACLDTLDGAQILTHGQVLTAVANLRAVLDCLAGDDGPEPEEDALPSPEESAAVVCKMQREYALLENALAATERDLATMRTDRNEARAEVALVKASHDEMGMALAAARREVETLKAAPGGVVVPGDLRGWTTRQLLDLVRRVLPRVADELLDRQELGKDAFCDAQEELTRLRTELAATRKAAEWLADNRGEWGCSLVGPSDRRWYLQYDRTFNSVAAFIDAVIAQLTAETKGDADA